MLVTFVFALKKVNVPEDLAHAGELKTTIAVLYSAVHYIRR